MISEKICPLCGNIFKVGFDPETGVEYPFRCMNIIEIDSSKKNLENSCRDICHACYKIMKRMLDDKKEGDQNE